MTQTLETDRLILRQPDARDWPAAKAFYQSSRAEFLGGPHDLGGAWKQFSAEVGHWTLHGCGLWAVTDKTTGASLGLVGPWCPDHWPENEIGWTMFNTAEGQGYAYEAAKATITNAFDTLGWDTAVSYIDPLNARSIALAERLGAVLDPDAVQPKPMTPCLVYRHPDPKGDV